MADESKTPEKEGAGSESKEQPKTPVAKPKVSKELKATVQAMPHIKTVYFDAKGNHFFNVHEHDGKKYHQLGSEVVVSTGNTTGRLKPVAIDENEIVCELSREEILK